MSKFTIHPAARIGMVSLTVSNLEDMVKFYCNSIGLQFRHRQENKVTLGTTDKDILVLIGDPKAKEVSGRTGLYHFAILLPGPQDLAQWLKHFLELWYRPPAAVDHITSEALYLSDPEGNGLKIYYDQPRETWPFEGDKLKIVADPLNLDNLLAAAPDTPWTGISNDATLGHIHLKVNNLDKNAKFYVDLLGFEVMQGEHPGALFVSAGGYHHHIGANTWYSAGAPPPPPNSLGLYAYTIQFPDERARRQLVERLENAQYPIESAVTEPVLHDPAGNTLVLTIA